MKKRIEVPLWVAVASVSLHVLLGVGIIAALLMPLAKTAVIPTAMATATATASPTPKATVLPTATPVPCGQDEVLGVDCPIDVGGLAVTVVSQERSKTYFNNSGIEKGPPDETYEVLVINLRLPLGTVKTDLDSWFEDGLMHAPVIVDEAGYVYQIGDAWSEEVEKGFGVVLVFAIPKGVKGLTLDIQYGAKVDLSQVSDVTVTVTETPVPSSSSVPSATVTPPSGQQ